MTKAADLDVSVMAITDHNSVSGVPVFRQFAERSGITIFPGFELTSSKGIHVLCIYPPDTGQEQLGRYLGEFGIRGTEPSADPSNRSLEDILEIVQTQRGITIAAHATTKGGLLKVLSGQARINAWRDPNLLAIQIPGAIEDLPQDLRAIVENKNREYRRAHPADERQALAVVNAKDVTAPKDLDDRAATCWIKMSDVSIEGPAAGVSGSEVTHRSQFPSQRSGVGRASRVGQSRMGRRVPRWCGNVPESQPQRVDRRSRRREIHGHRESALRAGTRPDRRRCGQGASGYRAPRVARRDEGLAPGAPPSSGTARVRD